MSTVLKYTLMQVPGALFVGVLLLLFHRWGWLSPSMAAGVMFLWVLKDALLYPLYRRALEAGPESGAEALAGLHGRAATTLNPRGLVIVRGERWQACSVDDCVIGRGTRVYIHSVRGMLFYVEPVDENGESGHETDPD